ncbi:MAG: hypothetical protein AAF657_03685 [Acidobacteriota bacterium]
MQHRNIALIALALTVSLPLTALAEPGLGERGARRGRILPPPGYLDLSDEQIEAAEALRESFRPDFEALRSETQDLRQQLQTALAEATPAPTQVGELVIVLEGQKARMSELRAAVEGQFAALLNEEQLARWENFKELREGRVERRKGRFGKRFQGWADRF